MLLLTAFLPEPFFRGIVSPSELADLEGVPSGVPLVPWEGLPVPLGVPVEAVLEVLDVLEASFPVVLPCPAVVLPCQEVLPYQAVLEAVPFPAAVQLLPVQRLPDRLT